MKLNTILEALKPSEYRKFVKGWDKSKYEELFKKYTDDKKAYRIYLPIHGTKKEVTPPDDIEDAVKSAGYEIEDYLLGIASKDQGKRKIKIGKLLKDPELQKKFANDPQRAASKNDEYFAVISRHPYDIAGMSTDRGWRSCMNLRDGVNRHYVPMDVKEGTIVAYVVKSTDKNINNPVGRVLIKPFFNTEKKDQFAFGIEAKVYGTNVSGFLQTVEKWVKEVNDSKDLNGIFRIPYTLYVDGGAESMLLGKDVSDMDKIKHDLSYIRYVKNPTDEMIKYVLDHGFYNLKYIRNPSEKLITKMIKEHGYSILRYVNEPSQDLLDKAFEESPFAIEYFNHQTPELQKKALDRIRPSSTYIWQYFKNPTDDVMWHALNISPDFLSYFTDKQTEEMHDYVIEKFKDEIKAHNVPYGSISWIRYLKNPTEKIIRKLYEIFPRSIYHFTFDKSHGVKIPKDIISKHLSTDPNVMKHVPMNNFTKDQQREAVKKNEELIAFVSKPIKIEAIKDNPKAIRYINTNGGQSGTRLSQTALELSTLAMERDPSVIQYIEDPLPWMQQRAVNHDPKLILAVRSKRRSIEAIALALHKAPEMKPAIVADLKKSRLYGKNWDDIETLIHKYDSEAEVGSLKEGSKVKIRYIKDGTNERVTTTVTVRSVEGDIVRFTIDDQRKKTSLENFKKMIAAAKAHVSNN